MQTWKIIEGFGGHYQISEDGLIRVNPESLRPIKSRKELQLGQSVKTNVSPSDGYLRVNLKRENGVFDSRHVHRLLMLTFYPPEDKSLQVNHKDGNKLNNSFSNLEWVTHQENLNHAWANKLRKQPSRAILTIDQVKEIRSTYCKGQPPSLASLGNKYGVSAHAIHKIITGKNWKQHV